MKKINTNPRHLQQKYINFDAGVEDVAVIAHHAALDIHSLDISRALNNHSQHLIAGLDLLDLAKSSGIRAVWKLSVPFTGILKGHLSG